MRRLQGISFPFLKFRRTCTNGNSPTWAVRSWTSRTPRLRASAASSRNSAALLPALRCPLRSVPLLWDRWAGRFESSGEANAERALRSQELRGTRSALPTVPSFVLKFLTHPDSRRPLMFTSRRYRELSERSVE